MMRVGDIAFKAQNRLRAILSEGLGRRMTELRPSAPVVSFSFDDFPASAARAGAALLERHGVAGTFYVSLGLVGQESPSGTIAEWEDLERLLERGHEIGCHTYAHCDAWSTKPGVFDQSSQENERLFQKRFPGSHFETLAYPKSRPRPGTKRRAGRRFLACRGGGQQFNLGRTDLNLLRAFFIEKCRGNLQPIQEMIERNAQARGWLIFATHDVCEPPSPFGCSVKMFEQILLQVLRAGASILPVGKALRFARGLPAEPLAAQPRVAAGVGGPPS